ncbi:hypothetical protein IV203_009600 [Nitzschia inconspicua]|uniref:Uncharacterized protein n=1 Tax=Nitzschia inconspicua TaxID=303405 RepID=A0A9K3KUK0_9STRA|nr:hypothetical protein IV203_009600 [Nitzschia inconspicua]
MLVPEEGNVQGLQPTASATEGGGCKMRNGPPPPIHEILEEHHASTPTQVPHGQRFPPNNGQYSTSPFRSRLNQPMAAAKPLHGLPNRLLPRTLHAPNKATRAPLQSNPTLAADPLVAATTPDSTAPDSFPPPRVPVETPPKFDCEALGLRKDSHVLHESDIPKILEKVPKQRGKSRFHKRTHGKGVGGRKIVTVGGFTANEVDGEVLNGDAGEQLVRGRKVFIVGSFSGNQVADGDLDVVASPSLLDHSSLRGS